MIFFGGRPMNTRLEPIRPIGIGWRLPSKKRPRQTTAKTSTINVKDGDFSGYFSSYPLAGWVITPGTEQVIPTWPRQSPRLQQQQLQRRQLQQRQRQERQMQRLLQRQMQRQMQRQRQHLLQIRQLQLHLRLAQPQPLQPPQQAPLLPPGRPLFRLKLPMFLHEPLRPREHRMRQPAARRQPGSQQVVG